MFLDSERTLDGLRAAYPSQVDGYRRYLADALPVAELVLQLARTKPTAGRLAGRAITGRSPSAAARLLEWSRRSVDHVFAQYFSDWHVTMPAISVGPTVWGVPPDTPGTGLAALGYASRHLVKTGRPKGGSGALTDAVGASLVAAGGQVRCDSWVERLLVRDGTVEGVALTDGTRLEAPVVVAACDPQRVFLDWLDETPAAARRLVERWRARPVFDGYESKVDAVVRDLPVHGGTEALADRHPGVDLLGPTTVVSPSRAELGEAHRLRGLGRVAEHPTLLFNMPSVTDPTMKGGSGRHILSLEVLFTPYAVEGGWPNSPEPARWLQVWGSLMEPGAEALVEDWRSMTPDIYERDFAMHRGHTPAFAGSPLSTLVGRQPELTRYRTPIDGLYLSGAATHPGAGIFGAAGRNTAAAVERDLRHPLHRRAVPVRRRFHALAR